MDNLFSALSKSPFGSLIDPSNIKLPTKQPGDLKFNRLLTIPKLSINCVYDECRKHFLCQNNLEDFDFFISKNERSPVSAYAIWVCDNPEPDQIYIGKSADDVKALGICSETFLERLVHELSYFLDTGKHLDVLKETLCCGSRYSNGGVPCVYWFKGELKYDWVNTRTKGGPFGCREVRG